MIYFDLDQWEWGSRTNYPDGTKRPFNPDKVVVHYGGTTDPGDGQDFEMDRLRRWQRYHIDNRGWTDIAYNFAVGQSGICYRLRGSNRSGAQSGDYENDGIPENHEAFGIVWIGGVPHEPSAAAYASMGRIIRSTKMPTVIGHSDIKGTTACPGDFWRAWIARRGWEDDSPVVTPPVEGDYEMRTVRRGDGYNSLDTAALRPTVKAAQAMLAHHGYADENSEDGTCATDGIFGPGTETAVKDYQQFVRIVIDGQVGPETWEALEA